MLKITAKKNGKELLGNGQHLVTIKSVAHALAKANDDYTDQTPQIEVSFENKGGFIRHWFNLKGYKKNPDTGAYEVDPKSGARIEDAENSAKAIAILERLAFHAGFPEETEVDIMADLIDMEIGIEVKDKKVLFTMSADRVKAVVGATEAQ